MSAQPVEALEVPAKAGVECVHAIYDMIYTAQRHEAAPIAGGTKHSLELKVRCRDCFMPLKLVSFARVKGGAVMVFFEPAPDYPVWTEEEVALVRGVTIATEGGALPFAKPDGEE